MADTYTFITTSDDGARLWLNDKLIVDAWIDQGTTDHFSDPQKLTPGIYSLRMEYYEWTGGAVAQLSWQTPTVAREIIPAGPLQPPVHARAIYPKDGDVNVPQDLTLMWSTGVKAVTHDIYFGEDANAVAAATHADAGIYKGSQDLASNSWTPGALEWGKTYYWRIDEVNTASADSPWKSAVWSFTTANFLVVDDFESYTDEDVGRIFQTWIDGWGYTTPAPGDPGNGTGATVGYINRAVCREDHHSQRRSIHAAGLQQRPESVLFRDFADVRFASELDGQRGEHAEPVCLRLSGSEQHRRHRDRRQDDPDRQRHGYLERQRSVHLCLQEPQRRWHDHRQGRQHWRTGPTPGPRAA